MTIAAHTAPFRGCVHCRAWLEGVLQDIGPGDRQLEVACGDLPAEVSARPSTSRPDRVLVGCGRCDAESLALVWALLAPGGWLLVGDARVDCVAALEPPPAYIARHISGAHWHVAARKGARA